MTITGHAAAGRPRDPEVDRRITHAAVALFGEAGWAGFSLEAVARRAGVGKASIYLRWPTKERLLSDALAAQVANVADADTGTLRGDLVHLARQLLELYIGETNPAVLRLGVEAASIPGVAQRWTELRESQVLAARAMVRRGIRRGDVPAGTSVTLLLDTLCGGVLMHVISTPAQLRDQLVADADGYANRIVDFLLRSVLPTG
ncbi:MAG TPA: TetR/AcrR family transcriptional regulator [Pseudonocardia sp.]|jgi:AcrR family transcriptional regulator|nr:TetR/AcrR family transcriptional regulator [Pseudonocardia sp.]